MNKDKLSYDLIRFKIFNVGLMIPLKKVHEKILTVEEALEEPIVDDFVLGRLEEKEFFGGAIGQGYRGEFSPLHKGDEFCIKVDDKYKDEVLDYVDDKIAYNNVAIQVNKEDSEICGTYDSLGRVRDKMYSAVGVDKDVEFADDKKVNDLKDAFIVVCKTIENSRNSFNNK